MSKKSNIPLFYGLNIQFILYFLLFAYIPLLFFSIFGYYLNRDFLNDAHHNSLSETNRMLSLRILDFIDSRSALIDGAAGLHPSQLLPYVKSIGFDTLMTSSRSSFQTPDSHRFRINPAEGYLLIPGSMNKVHFQACYPLDGIRDMLGSDGSDEIHYLWHEEEGFVLPTASGPVERENLSVKNPPQEGPASPGPKGGDPHYLRVSSPLAGGWELVSARSGSAVFSKLDEFLMKVIIANVIIGVLMLSMAFFLAQRISRPIRSLITAVQEISSGDLSKPVRVKSKDEIKLLADKFEVMRKKLLESYSTLENKIEARSRQLKEAQFQISHQEKMASLGLMAAGIAHEIGNPLTSISSMAQIIRRRIPDKHIIGYINTIVKNIERISKIVRELVDFARPSSYESAMVNVNEVVRNAVGIVNYDRRAKNINIQLDLEPDLPELYLVEDQLYQVFFNILINAVDAMAGKKDEIMVRSFRQDHTICVQFEDTGVGIEKENQNRIFEPFFTTKGVGKGTGLGLSVSYGIIKNLNGEIHVESEVGKGSVFTVVLPFADREKEYEG